MGYRLVPSTLDLQLWIGPRHLWKWPLLIWEEAACLCLGLRAAVLCIVSP